MDNKIKISATGMTDRQINLYLKELAEAAEEMDSGGPLRYAVNRLPSLADGLRDVLDDMSKKITYLELVETTRSEDLTILIQEDLKLLHETSKSIRSCLQAIESCLEPLQKNREKHWRLFAQNEEQEFSIQAKAEFVPSQ
ncbi:hypothetical protein RCT21_11075 [Escherichia marmotae]|uniref:Chemotaxis protein CheZ n=1 Tax=Escherichia marmotae TaxID=1499973 RepID=A0ABU1C4P0_9ESCH|nr:hypothetical protein [Escherichia marmotae]MEC9713606.1 hypothetical protein [Escherichia coli]MDQ9295609.1 hypothetical protein [Escherichia marmotae]MEC9627586.1 hypothetical protein [Escherichia marmotae]MED9341624.1 hypothetical protein [Escherichia marmotae]MED9471322.1 hypothetical protein [Escherichia marmotae]